MSFIGRYKWWFAGAALGVLIIGFLAFRPDKLFVDDTVDESLADAFATEQTTSTGSVDQAAAGDIDTVPDAPSQDSESSDGTDGSQTTTTTTATDPPADDSVDQVETGPMAVASGDFYGIDHSAQGTATIYEQDGDNVLRFEDDTDIQNGPDLYVWLVADDDYEDGTPPAFIDLGKIKGNVGGQNYSLPPEYDPTVHQFVLIWCLRFAVPFAAAPLT